MEWCSWTLDGPKPTVDLHTSSDTDPTVGAIYSPKEEDDNVIGVPKRIKGTAVGHLTVVRCLTALCHDATRHATALRHIVKKVQPGPLPRATYKCRLTGSKGAQVDQSATVGVRYLSFAREGGNPTVTIEASAGFLVR